MVTESFFLRADAPFVGAVMRWSFLPVTICAQAAVYLTFAGDVSRSELIAGLGVVAIGSVVGVLLHRVRSRDLSCRAPWLRLVGSTALAIVRDSFAVGRVLLLAVLRPTPQQSGLIVMQPFDIGDDQAADAGRRGLVTLAASIAPNGFVLRVLDRRQALAIHRLAPEAPDADREWPT